MNGCHTASKEIQTGGTDENSGCAPSGARDARRNGRAERSLGARFSSSRVSWVLRGLVVAWRHRRRPGSRGGRGRHVSLLLWSTGGVRRSTGGLSVRADLCDAVGPRGSAGGVLSKRPLRPARGRRDPALAMGLGACCSASAAAPAQIVWGGGAVV